METPNWSLKETTTEMRSTAANAERTSKIAVRCIRLL